MTRSENKVVAEPCSCKSCELLRDAIIRVERALSAELACACDCHWTGPKSPSCSDCIGRHDQLTDGRLIVEEKTNG